MERMIELSMIIGIQVRNTFWKQIKEEKYTYVKEGRTQKVLSTILCHERNDTYNG